MSRINEFHEQAMNLAEEAFIAKRNGDQSAVLSLLRRALEFEQSAAEQLRDRMADEPSRSILYRSAAALAVDCGLLRDAERLIATALAGNPPDQIAEELRDLLERVQFERHLSLRDIELEPGEIQFSLAGSAIGLGVALSNVFIERVRDMERLIHRTVERMLNQPFRERGSTKASIDQGYSLWITTPRAGSFVVTMRLGHQAQLPGIDMSEQVVGEVVECFELLNTGQEHRLRDRIPEESYYKNFVALAKQIAPDGDAVTMVGLTSVNNGAERKLAITRQRKEIQNTPATSKTVDAKQEFITVTGRLKAADATRARGTLRLVNEESSDIYRVIVPEGMMQDIVRPLWDELVVVRGILKPNKTIALEDIERA